MRHEGNVGDSDRCAFIATMKVYGLLDGAEGELGGVNGEGQKNDEREYPFHLTMVKFAESLSVLKKELAGRGSADGDGGAFSYEGVEGGSVPV